jgi:general secretion pathway protein H
MRTLATGERARGFTLIELLVVLAILVGLTVAFPLARERLSPQRQVSVYARRVVADLRLLRAEAMRRNRVTQLRLDASANIYALEPENARRTLPAQLRMQLSSDGAASGDGSPPPVESIRFFPDGSSDGGSIVLQRDERTARLFVSALTGRVSEE